MHVIPPDVAAPRSYAAGDVRILVLWIYRLCHPISLSLLQSNGRFQFRPVLRDVFFEMSGLVPYGMSRGHDQVLLGKLLWPIAKDDIAVHDRWAGALVVHQWLAAKRPLLALD